MEKKKILYIWDADYPWDVRVEKICSTLQDQGNEIHIVARNLKKAQSYECVNGLHVHRTSTWSNDKLNYYLSFPLFFSPIWRNLIHRVIREHEIDIIIVRDLPMATAGVWAAKKFDIPVIFDMAEDYVAMLMDIWDDRKFSGFNLVVRNPGLAKLVERYVVKNVDRIFVVIDEAMEVIYRNGVSIEKATIVSNTPRLQSFEQDNLVSGEVSDAAQLDLIQSRYSAIYTGGIQMGRGIHTVIDAIPSIVQQIPEFLFVVVGDGYATKKLKHMAAEKGVDDYVLWTGWIDHGDLFKYISACKLGLIPHEVTPHVDTTIPNKIFDYMGCGLPVIASDARPLKRIISTERIGEIFTSCDPVSLSDAVCRIYKSKLDYGANAKAAVRAKYHWQIDSDRMLEMMAGVTR